MNETELVWWCPKCDQRCLVRLTEEFSPNLSDCCKVPASTKAQPSPPPVKGQE